MTSFAWGPWEGEEDLRNARKELGFQMFTVLLTRLVLACCVPALVHGVVVAVVCVTVHFGFFLFSTLFVPVLVYKIKT